MKEIDFADDRRRIKERMFPSMKKYLATLLLFTLIFAALLCPMGRAEAVEVDEFYVYFEGDCNVRDEPNLDGAVIGVYERGDTAIFVFNDPDNAAVDERDVRWYLVVYGEDLGWVSSRYAVLTGTEYADYEPLYAQADWERPLYYELREELFLMSKPDVDSVVRDTLPEGTAAVNLGLFCFDEAGRSWSYVVHDGQVGWIQDRYTIGVMS